MSRDIPRITLEMLHKLEDFEEAILSAAPESSRNPNKAVEIRNLRGCIAALKNSIRIFRGSGQQAKAG